MMLVRSLTETNMMFAIPNPPTSIENPPITQPAIPNTSKSPSKDLATASGLFIAYAKVVGDVNADAKVDIADLSMVGRSFGARWGSANWNSAADLNNDGAIDIADLSLVGTYFGS